MLAVIEGLNQESSKELALCDEKIEEARAAWLSQESVTTSGEKVTHGANMAVQNVMLYWAKRRKLLLDLAGVAEYDYLRERGLKEVRGV